MIDNKGSVRGLENYSVAIYKGVEKRWDLIWCHRLEHREVAEVYLAYGESFADSYLSSSVLQILLLLHTFHARGKVRLWSCAQRIRQAQHRLQRKCCTLSGKHAYLLASTQTGFNGFCQ